ncbi:MAG: aspartyl/asparaginyl beta-hydroxylase domain-containing protein [Polyangiaceae bacterium]
MKSRILGTTKLNEDALARDVQTILGWPRPEQEYSEYAFGAFHTLPLRTPSGDDAGTRFDAVVAPARPTKLCQRLEYIPGMVDELFDTTRLIMMRAYLLQDALLIPHRDYVEFGDDASRMVRLHVPLRTNPRALHSEEEMVFHMNPGEVWYLDVSTVHSAMNASTEPRLSLVLDFRLDGKPLESVFRDPSLVERAPSPTMIKRRPADPKFVEGLLSLGPVVDRDNYRDVLQLLSRVHFDRDVHAGACLEWLIEICHKADDRSLVEKSTDLKRFLVDRRSHGERMAL